MLVLITVGVIFVPVVLAIVAFVLAGVGITQANQCRKEKNGEWK